MLENACSSLSVLAGESLLGTAPFVENWFLLEAEGPYGENALEESRIDGSAVARLTELLAGSQHSKLLLIRNGGTNIRGGIRFIVGRSSEPYTLPIFSEYLLASYQDLLHLDLSEPHAAETGLRRPILLVCTNGKRDPCCALHGFPFSQRLASLSKGEVFECSHVGQHRFAPNVVAFPQCAYYGRMSSEEAEDMVAHVQQELLYLPRLRGRTIYPPPAQAAEGFLRRLPELHAASLALSRFQPLEENTWDISFRAVGELHTLTIQYREDPDVTLRSSCTGDKTHHPGEFLALEHRRERA